MDYWEYRKRNIPGLYIAKIEKALEKGNIDEALTLIDFLGKNHADSEYFRTSLGIKCIPKIYGIFISCWWTRILTSVLTNIEKIRERGIKEEKKLINFLERSNLISVNIIDLFEEFFEQLENAGTLKRTELSMYSFIFHEFAKSYGDMSVKMIKNYLSEHNKKGKVISIEEIRKKLDKDLQILKKINTA